MALQSIRTVLLNMALSCIWRFWVALVLVPCSLTLGCEQLAFHNAETKSKLTLMGRKLSLRCLKMTRMPHGHSLIDLTENIQGEDTLLLIHQALDQINKIFIENLNTAPWDSDRLETFLIHLSEQLTNLNGCVGDPAASTRSEEIQQDFSKMRELLTQQGFSDCAWERVRSRTMSYLQQIQTIIGRIQREAKRSS
ncbi:interferon alpha-1-like [Chiloscyllium plagiosum]|uniref:interferon alpha-1-like n=1 Tax=Chiloscyllium plagiosum TaxID=36176 RepID=UPI001CB7C624|nr:interferon alpha-1-like [Chiloscyllium plagiosum]